MNNGHRKHSRWYFYDVSNRLDRSSGISGHILTPCFLHMEEIAPILLRNFGHGGVGFLVAESVQVPAEFYLRLTLGTPPLLFKCRLRKRVEMGSGICYISSAFSLVQGHAFDVLTAHWVECYAEIGLDNFEFKDD